MYHETKIKLTEKKGINTGKKSITISHSTVTIVIEIADIGDKKQIINP